MLLLDNCPVQDVCTGLELNPNQVYSAKARGLKHVARFMAEFEDESQH